MTEISFTEVVLLAIGSWQVAWVVVRENGPYAIFSKLRLWHNGKLLHCINCAGGWAVIVLLGLHLLFTYLNWIPIFTYWFGIWGLWRMLVSYTGVGIQHSDGPE